MTAKPQRCLNDVFSVDNLSCKLAAAEALNPSSHIAQACFTDCRQANFAFVCGHAGRKRLQAYTEMLLDLNGPCWQRLPESQRLSAAVSGLRAVSDQWRRTVFYFQDPRFQLFRACSNNGGITFLYDQRHVHEVFTDIEARCGCPDCLDLGFGREAMCRWRADPCAVHADLCGALAHVRIGSASCERAHLIGQSMKSLKSKGVAKAASTVGARTYIGSAVQEAAVLSASVHSEVLNGVGMSLQQYQAQARGFQVGGARQPRIQGRQLRVRIRADVEAPRRRLDGFRVYRSGQWSVTARVGTPEFERRIRDAWSLLSGDEKEHYESRAVANDAIVQGLQEGDLTTHAIQQAAGALGPHRVSDLLRQLFVQTFDRIAAHPAWTAGLGLCAPSTALRADRVLRDVNNFQCARATELLFQYDPVITNNTGTAIPSRSCHSRHLGSLF